MCMHSTPPSCDVTAFAMSADVLMLGSAVLFPSSVFLCLALLLMKQLFT